MECEIETCFLEFLQQIARIQHVANPHMFDRIHPLRIALLKSLLNTYVNEQQLAQQQQMTTIRL